MSLAPTLHLDGLQPTPSASILLIEDQPKVAQSMALILNSAGFSVDLAPGGDLAISMAAMRDYDLVLLGPNPPQAAGGDLVSRLRVARLERPLRILSVSAAEGGDPSTLHIGALP